VSTERTPSPGQVFFILGLTIGLFAALALDRTARFFLDRDVELVRAVRDMASQEFVQPVEPETLMDGALRGMLSGLDRYSHYYGADEVADLDRETSGEFLGIGVVFRPGESGRILFAYPGSPADRAGLRVGDRIVSAAGREVDGLNARELQSLLRTDDGNVRLVVEGLDGEARDTTLQPEVVLDPTVRHARLLDSATSVGYLAIRSFSHHTLEEFDRAVAGLRASGMHALVIDLRANPGGILDAATSIANRFVAHGVLVRTRTRAEVHETEARPEEATLAGLPLVALIDGASASASEVLAAALQDHCAAVLVGEPTYGKGTVQTLKRVTGRRAVVKITTATYCGPSSRRIEHDDEDVQQSGIAPDLWIPLTDAEQEPIHRHLFTYSPPAEALPALHEWETHEDQPLIEAPPPDRQLDAAVALLTGKELELRAVAR